MRPVHPCRELVEVRVLVDTSDVDVVAEAVTMEHLLLEVDREGQLTGFDGPVDVESVVGQGDLEVRLRLTDLDRLLGHGDVLEHVGGVEQAVGLDVALDLVVAGLELDGGLCDLTGRDEPGTAHVHALGAPRRQLLPEDEPAPVEQPECEPAGTILLAC